MNELVTIGYIFNTKGLNGEVRVKPLTSKNRFKEGEILFLNPPIERLNKLSVEKAYPHKDNFVVKFNEITNINKAELLKEHYLQAPQEELLEGEFYLDDLFNMSVFDENNQKIGEVTEILENKAHEILHVKGAKEALIPLTKEFIKNIDFKKKRIDIKAIEGLINED